jgi:hypothetical protein
MEGLLPPQSKSLLHLIRSKSRPAAPRADRLRILRRQPEPGIIDELGRLREYQGDSFATDPVPSNYAHGARARA